MSTATERQGRVDRATVWTGAMVGPTLLLLAAWFLWGPSFVTVPQETPSTIPPDLLSTGPRRVSLGDPPMIEVDGKRRTCMDCHHLFRTSEESPLTLLQHEHVRLVHGVNDRCRNCHDAEDRNKLVLHDGTTISFTQSSSLCGKCHGLIHRDWVRGIHGRSNGYWDASRGPVRRLACVECHNPHNPRVPAMDRIAPLPGPSSGRPSSHGARREADEYSRIHPARRPTTKGSGT